MLHVDKLKQYIATVQGVYFALTGIWPLVHYTSFEFITGPKTDVWLVKAVGVLVLVTGLAFLSARKNVNFSIMLLATGAAIGLAAIDIIYVLEGTIRWVYLLDAVVEIVFFTGWAVVGYLAIKKDYKEKTG